MTPRAPDPVPEGGGPAGQPTADAMMARTIRITGPAGVLDVWLGTAGDLEALERDVREVSSQGADRLDLALDLVTRHCGTQAIRALDLAETMLDSMDARSRLLFGIREDGGWRGPEQIW